MVVPEMSPPVLLRPRAVSVLLWGGRRPPQRPVGAAPLLWGGVSPPLAAPVRPPLHDALPSRLVFFYCFFFLLFFNLQVLFFLIAGIFFFNKLSIIILHVSIYVNEKNFLSSDKNVRFELFELSFSMTNPQRHFSYGHAVPYFSFILFNRFKQFKSINNKLRENFPLENRFFF